MHALVRAVLLRMGGQDPLRLDAEPNPPHAQRRQPVQAGRRERHAVVGADRAREPIVAEQPLEDGLGAHRPRRAEAAALEQKARMEVGDCQRVVVLAVAVRNSPLKSAVHKSFGARVAAVTSPGCVAR